MVEAQRRAALQETGKESEKPAVSDAAQAARLDAMNKNLLVMLNETYKTQNKINKLLADMPLWNMMLKDLTGFGLVTGFIAGPKGFNRLNTVREEMDKRHEEFANSVLALHKDIADARNGKAAIDGPRIAEKAQKMLEDYNRYTEGLITLREMVASYRIDNATKGTVAAIDAVMTAGMFIGIGAIASAGGRAIAKEGIREGVGLAAKALGQGAKAALARRMLITNGVASGIFTGLNVFEELQLSKSMKGFEASPQEGIASARAVIDSMESKLAGNRNADEIRRLADAERVELNVMEAQAKEPGYKVDGWRIAKTYALMFGTFLLFETGLKASRIVNAKVGAAKAIKADDVAAASGEEFVKGLRTAEGLKALMNRVGLDASAQENMLKNASDPVWKGGKMPSLEELRAFGYLERDRMPSPEKQWQKSMEFLADRKKRMETLRKEISTEFKNIGMQEKLANTYAEALTKLIDISERSGYTEYGHDTRTAAYVAKALEHMDGISPRDKALIRLAALVHDIGKGGVRNQLLRKPGPLEPDEYKEMWDHREYSYQILNGVFKEIGGISGSDAQTIASLTRYHHNKFKIEPEDEYVQAGPSGADIPLGSRIISVADNYDALLSPRSYREGVLSQDKVVSIMQNKSGRELDPELLKIFLEKAVAVDKPH